MWRLRAALPSLQPAGKFEQEGGMLAGEGEGGVDEGVGFDQGAVEVDAEGRGRTDLGGDLDGRRWEGTGHEVDKGCADPMVLRGPEMAGNPARKKFAGHANPDAARDETFPR